MPSDLTDPPQLKSQLSELLKIHKDMKAHITALHKDSKALPKELAEDFKRISKASDTLFDMVMNLESERPKANDDITAFWSKQRHDMRTSINGIKNYGEMILEDLANQGEEKFKKPFTNLIKCAEKCLLIIQEIGQNTGESTSTDSFISLDEEEKEEEWTVPHGGKILVIDDNADNREVLKRRLTKAGLTTLEGKNGYEGLRILSKHTVDLILLDIMMPGLDGYEVLDRLKSNDKFNYIPVLMISSVNELSSIVRCIEVGADDYLPTPFNPVLLKARITACLDKKRMADEQKASTQKLELAQKQLEAAIESIDEGFAIFDADDKLLRHNAPFKALYSELFEFGPETITYEIFLKENLANGTFNPDRRAQETSRDWINRHKKWHKNPIAPIVERILPKNLWVEIQEYKTPDGGTVSVHKDISKRKEEEERLEHLALHDSLTGLSNRAHFEEVLQETLNDAKHNKSLFSILYFDLDGFKTVNDTMGHEFGDKLLKEVASRIKSCVRLNDTVARLGGDEFSLILPHSKTTPTADKIAERALESIGMSISHNGETAKFSLSIGIATYPQDANTIEQLLKAADQAMYAAKKAGKGQFRHYADIKKKKVS